MSDITNKHSAGASRLLVCMQAVDAADSQAGVWISWLTAFSARFRRVDVICLREGNHALPENVRVHSLGKETAAGSRLQKRLRYIGLLLSLAWRLRHEYDLVFVHQNEEYPLTVGWLWLLLGKPIFMWRNHYAGSWRTRLAVALCRRVYCTSRGSFTARFRQTKLMPLGVDVRLFDAPEGLERTPSSILYLGRISRAKRLHELLEALALLRERGVGFLATFVGDAPPGEESYARGLVERTHDLGLNDSVVFEAGVPYGATALKYRQHEIFVNLSRTGMYDKTIVEAAACGCLVLACSRDYAERVDERLVFREGDVVDLASKLEHVLAFSKEERAEQAARLREYAMTQSLEALMDALAADMHV